MAVAGACGPADPAARDRPAHRRLVRPRLGHDSQAVAAAKAADVIIYSVGIASGSTSARPRSSSSQATPAASSCGDRLARPCRGIYAKISAALSSTFTFTYHSLVPQGTPIHLALNVPGYASATTSVKAPGKAASRRAERAAPADADERCRPCTGRGDRRAARALRGARAALRQARRPSSASGSPPTPSRKKRAVEIAGRQPGQAQHAAPALRLDREDHRLDELLEADRRTLEQADLPLRTAELVLHPDRRGPDPGRVRPRSSWAIAAARAAARWSAGIMLPSLFVRFKAQQAAEPVRVRSCRRR